MFLINNQSIFFPTLQVKQPGQTAHPWTQGGVCYKRVCLPVRLVQSPMHANGYRNPGIDRPDWVGMPFASRPRLYPITTSCVESHHDIACTVCLHFATLKLGTSNFKASLRVFTKTVHFTARLPGARDIDREERAQWKIISFLSSFSL